MSTSPVLLVHGAWGGAWAWGFVGAELDARGIPSTAIDLPSREPGAGTLADDAAAVRAALDELDEPAVLVGHSYAGMIITEASAANDQVAHLVYVCAILPQEGDSTGSLMASDPVPSGIGEAIQMNGDGTSTLDPVGAHKYIFTDATDEQVAPILPGLGTHRMSTFGDAASALGWQEHPSTYVLTTQDLVFSPALQRRMAASATEVVEVDSGHGPLLTQVGPLTDAIAKAAQG